MVDMEAGAKRIMSIIAKTREGLKDQKKEVMFNKVPPKPHALSYSPKGIISLFDIHPEEIARQMTIMESELFKAIKPWEYLNWNSKEKAQKAPNVLNMIRKFNQVSKWVQTELVKLDNVKQRVAVMCRFLEICEYLRDLNNYNGLMEILSGLNASAIFRLKMTWVELSTKQRELLHELNVLMSSSGSYKNLRATLRQKSPPGIPYLGVFLTDLTFLNDGNSKYLDSGLINFDKCRRVSAVIQEIIQYQQTPYCLLSVDDIQTYLHTVDIINDEEVIYKMSLVIEEKQGARRADSFQTTREKRRYSMAQNSRPKVRSNSVAQTETKEVTTATLEAKDKKLETLGE